MLTAKIVCLTWLKITFLFAWAISILSFCSVCVTVNSSMQSFLVHIILKITVVFNYNSNCGSWLFEIKDSSDKHIFWSERPVPQDFCWMYVSSCLMIVDFWLFKHSVHKHAFLNIFFPPFKSSLQIPEICRSKTTLVDTSQGAGGFSSLSYCGISSKCAQNCLQVLCAIACRAE